VRLPYCTWEEVLREERLVLRAFLPVLGTPSSGPSSGSTTRTALKLPPGEFCEYHSPWRIAGPIALNYNLSTCYPILVILQEPLFLHEMIKYIQ
jgi:hypothetical protein